MSASVKLWRENGSGQVGNGWVGEACSPGTSEAGTGRSSIGQTGSPVRRSKANTKPCLVGLHHRRDRLAVLGDGHQLGSVGQVVVPQVVVNDLEVPQPLAGARVEREQRVAEQVVARPVAAVEIEPRRSGRDEGDARSRDRP
jgi:hypothetical protein